MSERTPLPESITCRADVDQLLAAATNYEEKRPRDPLRKALDLDRVRALLASVGNPQDGPRTVHVAGSKGKGTVCRMIAYGLRQAGRSAVGLYTSPHLEDLSERIEIDGEPIAEAPLARAASAVLPHVRATQGTDDAPTFFEIFTAIAWVAFREAKCTDVVLETGLGGRLDATNVCNPAVTVITHIELEHTDWLGETIAEIAREKAGILKPGVPVVTYVGEPARSVVLGVAQEVGAGQGHLTSSNELAAAVVLRDVLEALPEGEALDAVRRTPLPGILETVAETPRVVIDGAHTRSSAEVTREALGRVPTVLLFAMLEGKDASGVAAALTCNVPYVITTRVDSPRSLPAQALADVVDKVWEGTAEAIDDLPEALARARQLARKRGLVLCTGSVYLAGAVRALIRRT